MFVAALCNVEHRRFLVHCLLWSRSRHGAVPLSFAFTPRPTARSPFSSENGGASGRVSFSCPHTPTLGCVASRLCVLEIGVFHGISSRPDAANVHMCAQLDRMCCASNANTFNFAAGNFPGVCDVGASRQRPNTTSLDRTRLWGSIGKFPGYYDNKIWTCADYLIQIDIRVWWNFPQWKQLNKKDYSKDIVFAWIGYYEYRISISADYLIQIGLLYLEHYDFSAIKTVCLRVCSEK